jgi:hypothetical protein
MVVFLYIHDVLWNYGLVNCHHITDTAKQLTSPFGLVAQWFQYIVRGFVGAHCLWIFRSLEKKNIFYFVPL